MTTATIAGVGTAEFTTTDQPMTVRQFVEAGLTKLDRSPAAAQNLTYIVDGKNAKPDDIVLPGADTRILAAPRVANG